MLTSMFFVINNLCHILWYRFIFVIYFSIGFILSNVFSLTPFNQNDLYFSFLQDILFSMEVWSLSLIREILVYISSLISYLTLKYLRHSDIQFNFFIWLIFDMAVNSWKTSVFFQMACYDIKTNNISVESDITFVLVNLSNLNPLC